MLLFETGLGIGGILEPHCVLQADRGITGCCGPCPVADLTSLVTWLRELAPAASVENGRPCPLPGEAAVSNSLST